MPDTPLEEALSALSERFVTIRLTREDWRRELSPVIAAAKAAAVEPIAQALLEPTAITCDTDGAVLSDRLVRAIEGIAEVRRPLSTTATEEG